MRRKQFFICHLHSFTVSHCDRHWIEDGKEQSLRAFSEIRNAQIDFLKLPSDQKLFCYFSAFKLLRARDESTNLNPRFGSTILSQPTGISTRWDVFDFVWEYILFMYSLSSIFRYDKELLKSFFSFQLLSTIVLSIRTTLFRIWLPHKTKFHD